MECLRLGLKDADFAARQISVRSGKGDKDRMTMLPEVIIQELQRHLEHVKLLHAQDLQEGFGSVELSQALERKCRYAKDCLSY